MVCTYLALFYLLVLKQFTLRLISVLPLPKTNLQVANTTVSMKVVKLSFNVKPVHKANGRERGGLTFPFHYGNMTGFYFVLFLWLHLLRQLTLLS